MSDLSGIIVSPAELIVPPPLIKMRTKKTPDNLALVLSVCGYALKQFGNNNINAATVLILLQKVIISVKKLTKLSEDEQKKLVLDSIQWIIENQKHLTDDEKQVLDILSETVFSQAVDLLSSGESGCFSCFKK